MATTYKDLNSSVPIVYSARAIADGVEIYPGHRLEACTFYQWMYDDLLGDGPVEIAGATEKTYTPDLTAIENSGQYFCQITIGTTGDCDLTTEIRTLSIIECLDQTDRTFAATGASGEVRVRAPHYEMPVFNNEGNDWINAVGLAACETQVANVCTFVQQFSLTDQDPSNNQARRGQPTLSIGEYVCFYNIVQDFIRTQAGAGNAGDQPGGPVISLTQNGPSTPLLGTIMISSTVRFIPAADTSTLSVTFTTPTVIGVNLIDNGDGTASLTSLVERTVIVTGFVTDSATGMTSSAAIACVFEPAVQADTTVITGEQNTSMSCFDILNGNIYNPGARQFRVSGGGNFSTTFQISFDGFFPSQSPQTPALSRTLRVVFVGPGIPNGIRIYDLTVDQPGEVVTETVTVTNAPGLYSYTMSFGDNCSINNRQMGARAWATSLTFPNNFFGLFNPNP